MSSVTYGLTQRDLFKSREKIKKQKNFLESNTFVSDTTGEEKTFLDVSYAANISERYYARIYNKVNTFVSLGISKNLVPIFLTVTLDGFFRDLLKGNYTRYTLELEESYKRHIPNSDRNGFYRDYMTSRVNSLTPKDLYKILSHQLHNFNMSSSLRNIRKEGFDYMSIRVTEPHKDGVPHFHILMYVPEHSIASIYIDFAKCFPAPRNTLKLTKKNTKGKHSRNASKIAEGIYETHGFQTEVYSAVSYILKYLFKSFINLLEEKKLDYLQAWYVHNRIPRVITTHTLLAQDVYGKIAVLEDDWFMLSQLKKNGLYERNLENNYFKIDDGYGRIILGKDGRVIIFNNNKIVASMGKSKNSVKKLLLKSLDFIMFGDLRPPTFSILDRYEIVFPKLPTVYSIFKSLDDGSLFVFKNIDNFSLISAPDTIDFFDIDGNILYLEKEQFIKPVKQMSDLELLDFCNYFDFDKYAPERYALAYNTLIDRSLKHGDYLDIEEFRDDFRCDFSEIDLNMKNGNHSASLQKTSN